MRLKFGATAVLLCCVAWAGEIYSYRAPQPSVLAKYLTYIGTVDHRSFTYSIPKGGKHVPTLLYLHGCGGNESQSVHQGFDSAARSRGFAIVSVKSKAACWRVPADLAYLAGVYTKMVNTFSRTLGLSKWYIAGASSGAFMAIKLHCNSDLEFPALRGLALCGAPPPASCTEGTPAVVVQSVGREDHVAPRSIVLDRMKVFPGMNNCSRPSGKLRRLRSTQRWNSSDSRVEVDQLVFGNCAKETSLFFLDNTAHKCPHKGYSMIPGDGSWAEYSMGAFLRDAQYDSPGRW